MSLHALLLVLGLGMVNWIATEVVVTSVIFKDVRAAVQWAGRRIEPHFPRIGEKVVYFTTCALCVGVWVGFVEAAVFGGPLRPSGMWAWSAIIANGLLYKAPGHLLLQINAWFHNHVELIRWQALDAQNKAKESRVLADLDPDGARARVSA